MKNQVQLIAYVDRLSGGGLREFQDLLDGPFDGLFGGVHLLPFFWPIDGADAGFDPIDHTKVDPRLGSWDDIRSLSRDVEIVADLIVNHISARSPQFLDFHERGDRISLRRNVSDSGPRLSRRGARGRFAPHLSPAPRPSFYEGASRRPLRASSLDYIHFRTDRYRRSSSRRQGLPDADSGSVSRCGHSRHPPRRGWLRHQEARARVAS